MPTHFVGGLAITYFFSTAIQSSQTKVGAIPKLVREILAVGLTALAAVGWEFLEFASDRLLGSVMNLGVTDTLSDLFFGIFGAVVAAAVLSRVKDKPARAQPPGGDFTGRASSPPKAAGAARRGG